ncbi:hypothetical protein HLRTI_001411 [Halorhabdus tiamatea SARL4B]|uniref:Uncharacterized protein n=1 Tax=Halorhabdus tiamatea SARL4B TaxID=1033806 RepID=U2FE13_9EURY|nr:hypothetical protein HLRTI_001411 [Halorhabdus tiamatea SARL4B]
MLSSIHFVDVNEEFVDALREEFRPRAVAAILAVLVALAVVSDDLWQVAYLGALAALAGVLSAAMEAEMLDRRLVWIGVGCVLGVGGTVLWLSGEGNVAGRVLAAVALLAGPWLALDSAVARWTGIDAAADRPDLGLEDADAGEAMLTMQVTRLVHEELRAADHPLTVGEVAERTDIGERRVETALKFLEHDARATATDAGYVHDDTYAGKRGEIRRLGRRLTRPVRLLAAAR